jgi:adenylate cyclase
MKMWHVLITVAVLVAVRLVDPFLLESSRLSYFDFLQRGQDVITSEQIVLVDIDEQTLEKFGQYPIPRSTMADEVYKLGNSIIAFNILFSEPDRLGGDDDFGDVLFEKNALVAIAPSNKTNIDYRPQGTGYATFGDVGAEEIRPELSGMLFARPEIMDSAIGYGTISSTPDADGITRRIPLLENFEGRLYPALALDILRVAAGDISYQIKTDELGIRFVRIPKFDVVTTDDMGNVNIAFWNEFNRYSFTDIDKIPDGSIAIVGATFEGSNLISTPLGSMYPHDVQANLLKTMIGGVTISRLPEFKIYEIALTIIGSLLVIFMLSKISILISGVGFGILAFSAIFGANYAFGSKFLLFDPIFGVLTLILVFAHGSFVQFYTNFKQKQMIKGQFGTYLSPDMVEMLANDPSLMKLGGERKEMTFLFMDICGFTPISEHYKNNNDPEGLVALINDYLNQMTNIILENGGTIDKYMGDCIMAFWNAPLPCENHAEMAVKSAIQIEQKTNELRERYCEQGLPPINVGTGINTGDCIVGNMGSESRFDYSVIGDAVNLAARLEATAARGDYLDYKTIYSSYTMERLETIASRSIGKIKVKGKDEEIEIYTPEYK